MVADGDQTKSVKVKAPIEKDERRKIHMFIKVFEAYVEGLWIDNM